MALKISGVWHQAYWPSRLKFTQPWPVVERLREALGVGGMVVESKMKSFLPSWSLIQISDWSGVRAIPWVRWGMGEGEARTRWMGLPWRRSTTSKPTWDPRQTKARESWWLTVKGKTPDSPTLGMDLRRAGFGGGGGG